LQKPPISSNLTKKERKKKKKKKKKKQIHDLCTMLQTTKLFVRCIQWKWAKCVMFPFVERAKQGSGCMNLTWEIWIKATQVQGLMLFVSEFWWSSKQKECVTDSFFLEAQTNASLEVGLASNLVEQQRKSYWPCERGVCVCVRAHLQWCFDQFQDFWILSFGVLLMVLQSMKTMKQEMKIALLFHLCVCVCVCVCVLL
jgi:hypothetical protein